MLSDLQTIARQVSPIALDLYDRSAANALLPVIAQVVPNPTRAKSLTKEWVFFMPNLRLWVGERAVQKSFQGSLTIVGEKFEITDAFDRNDIERGTALATVDEKSQAIATGFAAGKVILAYRVLRENRLAYDGQDFFDTDHVHPDGTTTYSNVITAARVDPARPTIFEARQEINSALLRLMQIRLWGDQLANADDVRKNVTVFTKSQAVYETYEALRTEDSFGADRNTMKGTFAHWHDYHPVAGTENSVDIVLSVPGGPRPVLFMPTREPQGIEFDITQGFKSGLIFFGMDGEYGAHPGFPQCAVRVLA
jgi:hypothetical protein